MTRMSPNGFDDQDVSEFVHGDPGQEVCLSEDDSAAVCILAHDCFAVVPGVAHSSADECWCDAVCLVAGQHADADLGMAVDEAVSKGVSVEVADAQDGAVRHVFISGGIPRRAHPFSCLYPVDLVVVDPLAAGFEASASAFLNINHGRGSQILVLCREIHFIQPLCCCHLLSFYFSVFLIVEPVNHI